MGTKLLGFSIGRGSGALKGSTPATVDSMVVPYNGEKHPKARFICRQTGMTRFNTSTKSTISGYGMAYRYGI